MSTVRRRKKMDRAVAAGLAVATGLGLTGLVAVRAAEAPAGGVPTEPQRAALDDFAEQLTAEAARLAAYRESLRAIAEDLAERGKTDEMLSTRIDDAPGPSSGGAPLPDLDADAASYGS